jgi:uncharacterized protein YndB with AHSA1/START domain
MPSVEVDRPPAEVFAYITDPGRFGEWQHGFTAGRLDGGPVVGARCVTTRKIGLSEREVVSELTHVEPPRTWGVRGVDGPIRATVNVVVDPLDEGRRSRLTIDVTFTGHGIGRILVPLVVRRQARAEMPANLDRAKRNLEAG